MKSFISYKALTNYNNQTFYLFNEKTANNVNGSVLNYIHNRESLIEYYDIIENDMKFSYFFSKNMYYCL